MNQFSSRPNIAEARRELDTRRGTAVIRTMRMGPSLHVRHERTGQLWWLSVGEHVPNWVARAVIVDPNVIGTSDSLFARGPSQTYRYAEKWRIFHV
jgi:hypothetical protein